MGVFVDPPEYGFTGISQPGRKLISQQPEQAKMMSLAPAVSVNFDRIQPCLLFQKTFQHKNGVA
jgi:hypothetical protein